MQSWNGSMQYNLHNSTVWMARKLVRPCSRVMGTRLRYKVSDSSVRERSSVSWR